MRVSGRFFAGRLLKDTRGQTLFIVAMSITAFIGLAGLSLDLGNYYSAVQVLQASTNVAAIAGAAMLPDTTAASNAVNTYSSKAGDANAVANLQNVTITPNFECLVAVTNQGIPCRNGTGTYTGTVNAVRVVQVATVPLWFGRMFGVPSWQAGVTSTASMWGLPVPTNIALIIDATFSQLATDDSCGSGLTEMQCEVNGIQTFMQNLDPCKPTQATCTISNGVSALSVDRLAIFTIPGVDVNTVTIDDNCTTTPSNSWMSSNHWMSSGTTPPYWNAPYQSPNQTAYSTWPNSTAYSFPTVGASSYVPTNYSFTATGWTAPVTQTYEVTLGLGSGDANGFFSDYKLSDTATTLNTDSLLVKLAGGVSGCAGMTTPNYDGTYGTYYAGAIYAAQAALVAEQAANPGSNNALIILTDGAANGSATNSGLKYKAATGTCASGSGCPIPILPSSTTGTTVNGLYADASGNYPSYKGTCGQAVVAANYAKSQGTTVFTIGYGSETTSDQCPTDVSFGSTYANITPCQAMAAMATDLSDFYTANQSGYAGTPCSNAVYCQNNVGTTSGSCTTQGTLSTIFAALVPKLTAPRLIPNGTT